MKTRYSAWDLLCIIIAYGMVVWWAFFHVIPHDAGMLSEMALRVAEGQLPHLDFDDTYTGWLNWVHALAFKLFGVRVTALRICLIIFAAPWLLALQWLFKRILPFPISALALLASAVWTIPLHSESMPSWYNVFLTTWGIVALWKHAETDRIRWLVVAGFCGGLSALFKITGILFLVALALYVLGRLCAERADIAHRDPERKTRPMLDQSVRVFIILLLMGVGVTPLLLIRLQPTSSNLFMFSVPVAAWAAFLAVAELRGSPSDGRSRLLSLVKQGIAACVGALVPISAFLAVFALRPSGLEGLFYGVFVLPQKRIEHVSYPLDEVLHFLWAAPLIVPLLVAAFYRGAIPWLWRYLLPCLLVAFLLCPLMRSDAHLFLANAVRGTIPVLSVIGGFLVLRNTRLNRDDLQTRRLLSLLPVLGFVNFLQFPFAHFAYLFYFFPLVLLAYLLILAASTPAAEPVERHPLPNLFSPVSLALVAIIAFPILWIHGHEMVVLTRLCGWHRVPTVPFDIERGDRALLVPAPMLERYIRLNYVLSKIAPPGTRVHAEPDCSQVPFFAKLTSVNPSFFACLGKENYPPDPERLRERLRNAKAEVVVINHSPIFSEPLPASTVRSLLKDFPRHLLVEDTFLILYK